MKTEVIESLQSKLESLVDSRTKELEDRKRRDTNLVVFNVPEHHHPRGEDNKKGDIDDMQRLSSSLGLENLQIIACFRLGRKKTTSNRPLKLVLEIKSQKQFLLDKFVPDKAPMYFRQVIIARDLTPTQREDRRKRRGRARNAESDARPAAPLNANVSDMDTGDAQAPSPIPRGNFNDTTLVHLNRHSSTSVFDESTVVDQHIDPHPFSDTTLDHDATVIGGMDDARSTGSASSASAY